MPNLALPSGSNALNEEIDQRDFPISLSFSLFLLLSSNTLEK